MRLGFTGSRHGMSNKQKKAFIQFIADCPETITEFHYGDCIGADEQAIMLLVELGGGGVLYSHPATLSSTWDAQYRAHTATKWPELGIIEVPAMNPLSRNIVIVESCDLLLATPARDSRGTYHTIRYADNLGKTVKVLDR